MRPRRVESWKGRQSKYSVQGCHIEGSTGVQNRPADLVQIGVWIKERRILDTLGQQDPSSSVLATVGRRSLASEIRVQTRCPLLGLAQSAQRASPGTTGGDALPGK